MLVTNNKEDFISLMAREPDHPGLVCISVAHGLMSLKVQQALFKHALGQVTDYDLTGQILEAALLADKTVRVDRYPSMPP